MENKYTVDYFIKKFEAIPEDKWCVGALENDKGQRCALGHCTTRIGADAQSTALSRCFNSINASIVSVNNGYVDSGYSQPTPKQRILAALYDIKKMQEPIEQDAPEKPHESIRYVTVKLDEQVQKLTKELILN